MPAARWSPTQTETGELVLQVTSDLEFHRTQVSVDGRQACVVQVEWTEAEVRAVQDDAGMAIFEARLAVTMTSSGGRLEVGVPVADLKTIAAIRAIIGDDVPLRIVGSLEILEP